MISLRRTLLELAKRCSERTESSRDLDYAIHHALAPSEICYAAFYTSSLDDAIRLIPKDHDYILEHVNGGLTIGVRVGHNDPDRTAWGETDALAMCAGALRAQANLLPED